MPRRITTGHARELVRDALLKAMPGADLDSVDEGENIRDALELDSLDFLTFVEQLGDAAGVRIDEDDYDQLTTIKSSVEYLTRLP
ncbi:acyl carrier protein [Saccharopolyspora erythraea NRRL 2338]|uniref:Phosphopantetheine-binding n=2 Tax=Saccharopolyspora erythraea TaxID=1836 RepID=A4FCC7_SACEN|nr:acyl carrier protein [Saccharopolyspora erythraea]EQD85000.1 phosphopantetheine-binding protein [Saccharopolyspora erythraea D]PFG95466.1 acyl carrier protein [Saccharopolyspora erythraea NRRL 2338]QRK92097.1 acyl carrier protein [Saccharopolyspora erythraea]CAM01702.1 phosphopantetheine-binding [Saccharopolyspora erythraea NRRL 2338]